MRPRGLGLVTLLVLAAGCVGAPTTSTGGCPTAPDAPPTDGAPVEVHVANARPEAACIRVSFDGRLVAAGTLEGEHEALHNNPVQLATLAWDARTVTVRVESDPGGAHEETVTLPQGKRAYVVAWVGEAGTTVRVYERLPAWV